MIGKNNIFNIRYNARNNWIGQTGHTRGFCDFSSIDFAIRAMSVLILRSYRMKNVLTISEIIYRFAPPSENNTNKYVDFVCSRLGVFPFDIPRDLLDYADLICAISLYETSTVIEPELVLNVFTEYKLTPYKQRKNNGKRYFKK